MVHPRSAPRFSSTVSEDRQRPSWEPVADIFISPSSSRLWDVRQGGDYRDSERESGLGDLEEDGLPDAVERRGGREGISCRPKDKPGSQSLG